MAPDFFSSRLAPTISVAQAAGHRAGGLRQRWSARMLGATLLFALAGLPCRPALAGRTCEETPAGAGQTALAFDAALNLQTLLNSGKQKVVIIARRGQNLDKYGVHYSHAAFAVRDAQGKGWSVFHELNTCGTNHSALYEQGLAEFFADDLSSFEVGVSIPEPWLQDRLVQLLGDSQERLRMHQPMYSAVAYPFGLKYQNSNGWVLETYARAASEALLRNRGEAQNWLRQNNFVPQVMNIGPMTRLGGRMFKANVAFDDHPDELRWHDRITVNTADDILRFVSANSIAQPQCPHGGFPATVCVIQPN